MKKKCLAVLTVAATLLVASNSFAALAGANTVNSAAIINGQVMTADLASGAVTATQLAAGAVTAAKIATGAITGTQLANGAVSDAKVTDVAMGKVTGLAAALTAKANVSDLATKADVGHIHTYENMAVVAPSGGEYTSPADAVNDMASWCGTPSVNNTCIVKLMPGTYSLGSASLVLNSNIRLEGSGAAVTKITGSNNDMVIYTTKNLSINGLTIENNGSSGWGNAVYAYGSSAFLSLDEVAIISTAQGVYVREGASLDMRDSNIKVNQISSVGQSKGIYGYVAPNINLSDVSIDVTGASVNGYANGVEILPYFSTYGTSLTTLNNVTINATATGWGQARGVSFSSYNTSDSASASLSNVKANAIGGVQSVAVHVDGPMPVVMNGVIGVASGTQGHGFNSYSFNGSGGSHTAEIVNSSFSGTEGSVFNSSVDGFAEKVKIANTKLNGPVFNYGAGSVKCIGAFDNNYDIVVCP